MDPSPPSAEVVRHGERPTVVVHVPHAGRFIDPSVRAHIVLDDRALDAELAAMTDHATDVLARSAIVSSGIDAIEIVNPRSRLVVDPERLPDDQEPMARIGMGAVYLSTSANGELRRPDPARDAELRRRYFDPYAAVVSDVVTEVLRRAGKVTIVDLHSFPSVALPYEPDPTARRPGVCVGTDHVHTPPALRDIALAAFDSLPGGADSDTPFAGTYVPLRHLGRDERVTSVMVEVRRDLYCDELTGELTAGADRVIAALARFLAAIA